MQNRLSDCRELLEQAELKVAELYSTAADPLEQARMAEALSFLGFALIAVSQSSESVEKFTIASTSTATNSSPRKWILTR